jgi:hypothetical protein
MSNTSINVLTSRREELGATECACTLSGSGGQQARSPASSCNRRPARIAPHAGAIHTGAQILGSRARDCERRHRRSSPIAAGGFGGSCPRARRRGSEGGPLRFRVASRLKKWKGGVVGSEVRRWCRVEGRGAARQREPLAAGGRHRVGEHEKLSGVDPRRRI